MSEDQRPPDDPGPTRLDVHSLIRKQRAGFMVKTFSPRLTVSVEDGAEDSQEIVISERIDSSIPWDR